MTFGRMNNLARRPVRPNGSYHRSKRRNRLDHMLSLNGVGRPSLLRSILFLVGISRRR